MAKSPADRYQSAGEMLADLQAVAATLSGQTMDRPAQPDGVQARRPRPAQAAAPPRRRRAVAAGGLGASARRCSCWRLFSGGRGRNRRRLGRCRAAGGEPIKVGVLHSLSGTMAGSEMVVVDAVLFAIDEINQAGGVLGRPVKAVVADGRSDWPTFAREAERLITQEKVCTVFGCWTSASRKTVKPVFEEHDHLLLYPVQYEGLETSPNIVYIGAAPNQQIIPAVEWAVKSLKKKRFFLVGSDYVFPRAANEIIKDHLKELGARSSARSTCRWAARRSTTSSRPSREPSPT